MGKVSDADEKGHHAGGTIFMGALPAAIYVTNKKASVEITDQVNYLMQLGSRPLVITMDQAVIFRGNQRTIQNNTFLSNTINNETFLRYVLLQTIYFGLCPGLFDLSFF